MDHQLQTVQVYNDFVQNYVDKFMKMELYEDTWLDFLALLPPNASLLELGCGPGNVAKFFLDQRPDLVVTGFDLAPNMVEFAKKLNPSASFEVRDIRQLGVAKQTYGAIVASFCMPYLSPSDLEFLFEDMARLLEKNGFIYLSCMEGPEEKSGFEKTSFTGDLELFVYYHSRENLERLIQRSHFTIQRFYTKDYPETDGSFTTDLVYLLKK